MTIKIHNLKIKQKRTKHTTIYTMIKKMEPDIIHTILISHQNAMLCKIISTTFDQKSKLVLESTALNTFLTCAITLHMFCQSQNYYGTMD